MKDQYCRMKSADGPRSIRLLSLICDSIFIIKGEGDMELKKDWTLTFTMTVTLPKN